MFRGGDEIGGEGGWEISSPSFIPLPLLSHHGRGGGGGGLIWENFRFCFFVFFLNQIFLCEGIHLISGQQVHSYVTVGGEGSLKILSKVTAQGEKRPVTFDISR